MGKNLTSDQLQISAETIRRFRNTLTTLESLAQAPVSDLDVQEDDQSNIISAYATSITGESINVLPLIEHFSGFSSDDVVSFIGDEEEASLIYAYCNYITEYLEASRAGSRLRSIRQDLMSYADSTSEEDANVAQDYGPQIQNILDNLNQASHVSREEVKCTICLENPLPTDNVVQLRCHETHQFHRYCLQDWLQAGSRSCPNCRDSLEVTNPRPEKLN